MSALFEYKHLERPARREYLMDTLRLMGEDGWQLVALEPMDVILMRQVTDEMQAERMQVIRNRQQRAYRLHMHTEHDHTIYIGDAVAEHVKHEPACKFFDEGKEPA